MVVCMFLELVLICKLQSDSNRRGLWGPAYGVSAMAYHTRAGSHAWVLHGLEGCAVVSLDKRAEGDTCLGAAGRLVALADLGLQGSALFV